MNVKKWRKILVNVKNREKIISIQMTIYSVCKLWYSTHKFSTIGCFDGPSKQPSEKSIEAIGIAGKSTWVAGSTEWRSANFLVALEHFFYRTHKKWYSTGCSNALWRWSSERPYCLSKVLECAHIHWKSRLFKNTYKPPKIVRCFIKNLWQA